MSEPLYFEDFEPGMTLVTESHTLSEEECVAFGEQFDPQYFHIDPQAAKGSVFGRLIASGWHTAAISMKLKAATKLTRMKGGLLGMGLEELRWPEPVFPGDTLTCRITVTEARRSASKPTHGVIRYKMETFNQHGACVMSASTAVWAPCRTIEKEVS